MHTSENLFGETGSTEDENKKKLQIEISKN